MYNVSSLFLQDIYKPSRKLKCKVIIGEVELTEDQVIDFSINSSLGNEGMPGIGGVVSSVLTLNLIRDGKTPSYYTNQNIKPYIAIQLSNNGAYEYIPLGVFKPKPDTIEKTDLSIKIECEDVLTWIEGYNYDSKLKYPTSAANVLNELKAMFGLEVDLVGLPSATVKVKPNNNPRVVISEIAELFGRNAIINRQGILTFPIIKANGQTLTVDNYIDFKLTSDDKNKISKLICEKNGNDSNGNELPDLEYGDTSGATLRFENDSITTQAELKTVFDRCYPINYWSYELKTQGMPHFDVGDKFTLIDKKDVSRELIVLEHLLTYNGGLISEFKANSTKTDSSTGSSGSNSISQSIQQAQMDVLNVQHILAGNITADNIAANAITADKIAAGAITADSIKAVVIEAINASIGDATIDSAKIDAAEIAAAIIKDIKVGTAQIDDAAITNAKIDKLAVGTANIQDAAITNAKIESLDAEKIITGTLDANRITASVITAINASIEEATINSAKIGNLSADKITTGSLSADRIKANVISAINASLETATINSAKIGNLNANKITAGDIDADRMKANAITAINASLGSATIDQAKIGDLDASKITSGYISADRIEAGSIDTSKINADTISAIEVSASEITANKIASGEIKVGDANIIDGTISGAKITKASIGNAQINEAFVADAYIQNITADKIKGGTLDAKEITVKNLNADSITVGQINGKQIAGGAISYDKLDEILSGDIRNTIDNVDQALEDVGLVQEKIKKTIKSVNVEYAQNNSSTVAPTSGWQTNPPTWTNGIFIWSRTTTILTDGTSSTTNPVCITGAKGATGATGQGVESITEEYYLSTSKTTQTGGSWTTTPPTWSTGKYIWTRSKIVYKNPTSTVYTTPVCDSSWEAVNEIQIGGRNLYIIKNSNEGYLMNSSFDLGSMSVTRKEHTSEFINVKEGETYIFQNWVTVTVSSSEYLWMSYQLYDSNKKLMGTRPSQIDSTELANGLRYNYYKINIPSGVSYLRVSARFYNDGKIKLEKGNKATDWSPAPEDVAKEIATVTTIANGKNSVYYSTSAPSITGKKENDIWFDTDDGYRMYSFTGGKWVATQFGTNAIVASAITSDKLAANSVIAGKISSGAVTTEKLYALAVTSDKVAANAITAGKIATDAISANNIKAGQITTVKLSANAVTADKLDVDNLFVGDNAFIKKLKAVEIDAANITTGKISSERIDINGLVTFEALNGDLQSIFNVQGNKTYINGGMIAANTIKADKIDLLSGISVKGPDGTNTFAIANNGEVEVNGLLRSGNFDEEQGLGYKIAPDGTAILNQAKIRGDVMLPNAGLTNQGSSSDVSNPVRIWAGEEYSLRESAPFRVYQDGSVFASNGTFTGLLRGILDSGDVQIYNNAITIHKPGTETEAIRMDAGQVTLDTDFVLGKDNDKRIVYANNNRQIHFNNMTVNAPTTTGLTSLLFEGQEGGAFSGLNLIGRIGGGHQVIRHSSSVDKAGTLVFDSEGNQGQRGDFSFTRKNYAEDVKVDIDGELSVKNSITSSKSNIEMRATSTGWSFYAI